MVLLPASLMAEEEFPSYLSREWIAKQLAAPDHFPRSDLWSVIHGALIDALEECAKANKAKMEYQSDGDGFFTYKGTIDVNVMASKIDWCVKNKLRSVAVVKAFPNQP